MTISRLINFIIFILCLIAFGMAYYVEYHLGFAPCSLCTLQRIAFAVITVFSFIAMVHNPKRVGRVIYAAINFSFSLMGVGLASRQLWLQQQPVSAHSPCLPGLTYLFKTLPWHKALNLALNGSLECGRVDWRLFGLSMAGWAFILFALFVIACFYLMARKRH